MRAPRARRTTSLALAAAVAAALVASLAPAQAGPVATGEPARSARLAPGSSTPPDPDTDPFYRYGRSLRGVAPGTVLKSRPVELALLSTDGVPVSSRQVLYRTTSQLGGPALAVATVVRPRDVRPRRLVSYQTFYDGLGGKCLPSYTLRGGNPGSAQALLDAQFMAAYLAAGYAVVTADYETVTSNYTAGQESGRATLDGIRAAQRSLGWSSRRTRVAMLGYSGGAIASGYAAELAPRYAPDLEVVGTAAGGVPVSLLRLLRYIDGSPLWVGVNTYAMVGLARGFRTDLRPLLTPAGREAVASVQDSCLNPVEPMLSMDDLFRGERFMDVPVLARMLRSQVMGRSGTPDHPLLLAVGNVDGRGDGVMLAQDVEDLSRTYCRRGVPVDYREYTGADHYGGLAVFEADAFAFVTDRLRGTVVGDDCDDL